MESATKEKIKDVAETWFIWLFPLFAILISAWLIVNYYTEQGPDIHIMFEDGSGLQPGRTTLRFRGVAVGVVKKVTVNEDNRSVLVTASLQKEAERFASEGSRFWVILPRVNFQGISGLETFFEGTYIAVQPGRSSDKEKFDFKGQLSTDTNESLEDTTAYFLETPNADSVNIGDTVSFRGLMTGTVAKITLSKTSQSVIVQVNIQNRYVKLIRANTAFWRKTGIQASLGLFKSEVKISSLESLVRGGIEFFTPDAPGEVAKAHSHFSLLASPPKDSDRWNPKLDL